MVESTLLLVTGRCLATAPWLQPVNNITLGVDAKRGKLFDQTPGRRSAAVTRSSRSPVSDAQHPLRWVTMATHTIVPIKHLSERTQESFLSSNIKLIKRVRKEVKDNFIRTRNNKQANQSVRGGAGRWGFLVQAPLPLSKVPPHCPQRHCPERDDVFSF